MSGLREALAEAFLQRDYPGARIEDGDDESDLMLGYADTALEVLAALPEHRDEVRALIGDEPTAKHKAVITHPREES